MKTLKSLISKTNLMLFVLVFGALPYFVSCGGVDPGNTTMNDTDLTQDPDPTLPDAEVPPIDNPDVELPPNCSADEIFIPEMDGCYPPPAYNITGTWENDFYTAHVTMAGYKAEGLEPYTSSDFIVYSNSLYYQSPTAILTGTIEENGTLIKLKETDGNETFEFIYTKKLEN